MKSPYAFRGEIRNGRDTSVAWDVNGRWCKKLGPDGWDLVALWKPKKLDHPNQKKETSMKKEAIPPCWYVGEFTNRWGKRAFRVLRLRNTANTFERLLNGLGKHVLERMSEAGYRRVKLADYTIVTGGLKTQESARRYKAVLEGKAA